MGSGWVITCFSDWKLDFKLPLNVIKANLQTEITAALTQEERKIMAEKKVKLMVAIFINGIRG